ncbi:MAG: T9SS type A sorting domain-containing protein [Chitinophagaceae bacterium]|nr:T9SS type A sorting domain-containing protein [Chitinophagaceae bacterium]
MKWKYLFFALFFIHQANAQFKIAAATEFVMTGNALLTLQNFSFTNDGIFEASNGEVRFTGRTNTGITGIGSTRFDRLQIDKTNTSVLFLLQNIKVVTQIDFSAGNIDLQDFTIDLGATGKLIGEKPTSRIQGGGFDLGTVIASAQLNSPLQSNPGNLGFIISSTKNLGLVTIRRGHQFQTNSSATGSSIERYYDVEATTNSNLDATIRVNYFDEELNAIDESKLSIFHRVDATTWIDQGFSFRNTAVNFVEQESIAALGRITLSNTGNILPLIFSEFRSECAGTDVVFTWKTLLERNSSHFEIEGSEDNITWNVLGRESSSGNSSNEKSYSVTVNAAGNKTFRIAHYSTDRSVQYSKIITAACDGQDRINAWPNPARDNVFLDIESSSQSNAFIELYDGKGSRLLFRQSALLAGRNRININISSLPKGVYHLHVMWQNGAQKKNLTLLRQ